MEWFWNYYCDPADRTDPKASPLRADDLSGLPPAMIVTCEFDPLRDEGNAYAEALAAAGVPVRHLQCKGQTHTSLGMPSTRWSPARTPAPRWPTRCATSSAPPFPPDRSRHAHGVSDTSWRSGVSVTARR